MKRGLVVNPQFSIYVGLDGGTEFDRACVLDSSGKVVGECQVDHSGKAITDFVRLLNILINGKPECIAVAIEVPGGQSLRPSWRAALQCSRSTQSSWTGFGIAIA